MTAAARILYCNCTHAQIVPAEVKETVLRRLCESGIAFEAVADLCELSARQDPVLQRLAAGGPVRIAACYPRAVKWLFAAAGASLPPTQTEVLNMRVQGAEEIVSALFQDAVTPTSLTTQSTPAAAAPPAAAPHESRAVAGDQP